MSFRSPTTKGICFSCTAPRCVKTKNHAFEGAQVSCKKQPRKPCFRSASLLPHPALWRLSPKPDRPRSNSYRGMCAAIDKEDHEENELSLKRGFLSKHAQESSSQKEQGGETKIEIKTDPSCTRGRATSAASRASFKLHRNVRRNLRPRFARPDRVPQPISAPSPVAVSGPLRPPC
jgi:hypothetical protein